MSANGPPFSFRITCSAFGPWIWNRYCVRVTALPIGRDGDRSSLTSSTSQSPVSTWNWIQFTVGVRPTNSYSFSVRWKRIPSPITWPS